MLIYDPAVQDFTKTYMYVDGWGWDDFESGVPVQPTIQHGQAFYLWNAGSTRNWTDYLDPGVAFGPS